MRPVPVDEAAEWDAIAIAVTSTPGRADLVADLLPADFMGDRPRLWSAVVDLHSEGRPVTVDTVAGVTGWDRQRLRTEVLQASPLHVADTVRRVLDAAGRRRALVAADQLARSVVDPQIPLADAVSTAQTALDESAIAAPMHVPPYDTWAADVSMAHDWVVPDLLERRERMILVAAEGAGKSYMLRQFAAQTAAGIHFRHEHRIEPRRALVIDAENSPRQIVRGLARIRGLCAQHGDWDENRFGVVPTSHVDLHRRQDRAQVEGYIRGFRPDLVVLGPLYKVFSRGQRDYDVAAQEACAILDDWRARYDIAMLIEHHAPKQTGAKARTLDPFGSSVFMRWPEVGLTLARAKGDAVTIYELGRFRPDREERQWPPTIMRAGGDTWPWRTPPDDRRPLRPNDRIEVSVIPPLPNQAERLCAVCGTDTYRFLNPGGWIDTQPICPPCAKRPRREGAR